MKADRICFVAENAYPLLARVSRDFMGGAELQQVLIGREMRANGYDVTFITRILDGRKKDELVDGIKVIKAYDPEGGLPLFRYLHPKITRLWSAMARADADVYYQRCSSFITGIVALFCRTHGRKFVYSAAHDNNFIPDAIRFPHRCDRWLYHFGLRNADHIIVQTERQKSLLRENYRLEGSVIHNVFERRSLTLDGKFVLWVANIKKIKRPFLMLEIAKKHPDIPFRMIGGPVEKKQEYYERFRKAAARVPNVEFLGFRPFEETERHFDEASLFVNTSEMEGFPNTYLQAWSRGIPTISFIDVDDAISRHGLGKVIRDPTEKELELKKHLNAPCEVRKRIQNHFDAHYSVSTYVSRFEALLLGACGKPLKRGEVS